MLTLRPAATKQRPWLTKALYDLNQHASDHPDEAEYRAAMVEMAALEDRLRELASGAAYPSPLLEAAQMLQDLASEIIGEGWRWDDDREAREIGNRADQMRVMRAAE